ncbi:MAG TPA: sulfotransferase [Gammaproteobacteria bacterium]|nr:sulfotransferase [Gammaproteobacteria bacterium]
MGDTVDGFQVDPLQHRLGNLIELWPRLFIALGNLETRFLRGALADRPVTAPIYIAGLARSGSTLLLELLADHPRVGTHRYRDFPLLHLPYAWNRFLDRAPRRPAPAAERSHQDGMMVTPESPEAFEEVLWMAFFPKFHAPGHSAVLGADTHSPGFEAFYRDHIRKLLLLRHADRYLSKGNYNVTRLEYLLERFPDARFLIPVRDPVWHIASLIKQQRLFTRALKDNPSAVTHLRRAGHFEFGPARRAINPGNTAATDDVERAWREGRELEGWAKYWALIHTFVADRLEQNDRLRRASVVVRFESLCRAPAETFRGILAHCALEEPAHLLERVRTRVRFPDYYRPGFSADELALIQRETATAARRLGLADAVERAQV